ncbi:hypothetical protein M514_19041 [Trichuris suis]|uniref:Uncharacterized protein n=1 Tax=Trichuris suis TaxID=68888 RepID=A0A085NH54_9BILA|nr:hypothetical protein M514_19041 [Trichuris suis]
MIRRNFIFAIKMRFNLIPTRLQTNRDQEQRTQCRRCGEVSGAQECLIHVAQNCSYNHGLTCRRHNEIISLLVSLMESAGSNCVTESLLKVGDATYKPDLVISKEGKCWTMDISIPYENKDSLAKCHKEKCQKYLSLSEAARELTRATEFSTLAFVIGERGAWCRNNC